MFNAFQIIVPFICVASIIMCGYLVYELFDKSETTVRSGSPPPRRSIFSFSLQKKLRLTTASTLFLAKTFHLVDYIRIVVMDDDCTPERKCSSDFVTSLFNFYTASEIYNFFLSLLFNSLTCMDRYRRIHLIVRGTKSYAFFWVGCIVLILETIAAIVMTLISFQQVHFTEYGSFRLGLLIVSGALPL